MMKNDTCYCAEVSEARGESEAAIFESVLEVCDSAIRDAARLGKWHAVVVLDGRYAHDDLYNPIEDLRARGFEVTEGPEWASTLFISWREHA